MLRIFGPVCIYDENYSLLLAKEHFMQNSYMYTALAFLSLLESPFIAYLPWYHSDFAVDSKGFPDMFTLQLAAHTKISQSTVLLICNIIFLVKYSSHNEDVVGIFYINMVVSVISALLSAMNTLMRNSILKNLSDPDSSVNGKVVDANLSKTEQGDISMKTRSNSAKERETNGNSVPSIEGRPAPPTTSAQPETHIRSISVKNPLNSDDGAPMEVDRGTSIRDWLADLVPDIDGPTLHALTIEFKKDSIANYGNVLECIDSGVLEVSDIKDYLKTAQLPKMKSVRILTEFQKIVSTRALGHR